ncbi:MAG: hypothetical protein MZV49_24910 [Rhodopseudomonas palustris]|nr:hypothetical protein [Rhodopseudomonas palustris]
MIKGSTCCTRRFGACIALARCVCVPWSDQDGGTECASVFIPGTFDPLTLGHRRHHPAGHGAGGPAGDRRRHQPGQGAAVLARGAACAMVESECARHRRPDRWRDRRCIRSRTC